MQGSDSPPDSPEGFVLIEKREGKGKVRVVYVVTLGELWYWG